MPVVGWSATAYANRAADGAGGVPVTVIVAVPVISCPPPVTVAALMTAVPGATAVTVASGVAGAPLTATVAIATLEVCQPTNRFGTGLPNTSVAVAIKRTWSDPARVALLG